MMAAQEFSRLVPQARVGLEPFRQEITAGEAERIALARRFDLLAVDRLSAAVTLTRQGSDRGSELILLRATFEAVYVQNCVVTLDPIDGAISGEFALLYGPPATEDAASAIGGDDIAFEPLDGEAIDIGEAVAQEFSLALPPFPRRPDAEIETGPEADGASPFAGLLRLVERRED